MTSTNWANLDKIRDFPNASDKTYKEALDALKKYRDSEEATNFTQRIDQWFESTKTLIGNATQKIEHQEKDKSLAYLSPTAKHLFDIHVGSVIRDTKKNILKGNKFEKIGEVFSFVGDLWDGLWDFWNSLKEQYNALKVLDTLIIKPAILTLYVSALPEIAILKTSQAIGTGLKEYGNSKNLWDSLKVGADKAFTSATKHFLYLSQIDSTHILIDDFKRYVKKTSPELTQAVTNICKDCNKMENLRSLLIKIESSTEIKDPAIQKTLVNTANRYFVEHTIEADYKKQTRMPKSKESFQSKHASHQNPQTSLKNTQITSSNIKLQS